MGGYEGECERLHGHNWKVRVHLESEKLNHLGLVMDFRGLKTLLGECLATFDHSFLNELEEFKEANPSTENIARVVYEKLAGRLPEGVRLTTVSVWESASCGASYSPSGDNTTGKR